MSVPIVFSLPGHAVAGERLACLMNAEVGQLAVHTFPDGESLVRVDSDPHGRDALIVASLRHPNDAILQLLFLADLLRDLGAARVGLVAPYLAYMRQDARFHPGEAVSARSFASILSGAVDWVVTVDPHLHRFASLSEVFRVGTTAVHAASELGAWIAATVRRPFIIGPDEESRQWAESVAAAASAPFTVVTKTRRGDADVIESIPDLGTNADRTPVLVDDIISTGRTMLAAVHHLREQHSLTPVCVGVHAVFAGGAYDALTMAGVACVATTNSIPHPSNRIDVLASIGRAVGSHVGARLRTAPGHQRD